MSDLKKRALLMSEYSSVQIFYWMGYCCIAVYAAVFLQSRGYTNTQLGTIVALGNAIGFLLAPLLASVIDKSERINIYHCLYALLGIEALMEILLILSPGSSLYVSILYCLLMACVVAVSPMNTELCFSIDRSGKYINFSFSRSFGSLAFSIITIILGRLCASYSPELLRDLSIAFILLQLTALTVLNIGKKSVVPSDGSRLPEEKSPGVSLSEFLSRNRRFVAFCLGTCVLMFPAFVMNSFFINIVESVGGTTKDMGILSAICTFCEVPVMLLYSSIRRKFKCSGIIRFASAMYIVRIGTIAFASNLTMMYVSSVTQMFCYALLIPALVDYASIVVDVKDSAKGQAVSAAMLTLSTVIASLSGGIMMDRMSVRLTMTLGLTVCAAGVLICFFTVDSKRA